MKTLSLILIFFSLGLFAGEPTFIYLVRHAEKQDQSRDPSLSELGNARVTMLKYFFEKIPLKAVYASQFKRTQETVTTIAADHQLEVSVIKAQDPKAQIKTIMDQSGGTFLIAGHSNTVPALIHMLGGPSFTMDETEYDDVFLVVLGEGDPQFQHFQMHAQTP